MTAPETKNSLVGVFYVASSQIYKRGDINSLCDNKGLLTPATFFGKAGSSFAATCPVGLIAIGTIEQRCPGYVDRGLAGNLRIPFVPFWFSMCSPKPF